MSDADGLLPLGRASDVVDGAFTGVTYEGFRLSLFRRDGAYYAIEDECPHERCRFSEFGKLDGDEIECSCHGSRFDAASGAIVIGPAWDDARVYPLKQVDDQLMLDPADLG